MQDHQNQGQASKFKLFKVLKPQKEKDSQNQMQGPTQEILELKAT